MEDSSRPDVAEVARARTLAGVCVVLTGFAGVLWLITGILIEGDSSPGAPAWRDWSRVAVLLGSLTQLSAALGLGLGLRWAPRFVPAALVAATIGAALGAAPLVATAAGLTRRNLDPPVLRMLALDCAALPLVAAALSAWVCVRHGRLFRSGAAG